MKIRAISAVVAVVVLVSVYYFFHEIGAIVISSMMSIGGIYEYSKLTFPRTGARFLLRASFFLTAVAIFMTTVWLPNLGLFPLLVGSLIFVTLALLNIRESSDLTRTLEMQSAGLVGFIYAACCPGLCIAILRLEHGAALFFGLLVIVFAGDTFAYLAGMAFGRSKLLEAVSPKKTKAGAVGGLLGSMAAAEVYAFYALPHMDPLRYVLIAFVSGLFAQVGDLFESQLKRIADVKDSGHIMPGHGGVLDRLDGVFFGGPIYYFLILYFSQYLT